MKALLPLLLLAAAAPLSAAPLETITRTVTTADLDLSSPVGVRTLEARLTLAINDACGAAADVDLAGRNAVRACRQDTRAGVAAERDRLLALAHNPSASQVASAR